MSLTVSSSLLFMIGAKVLKNTDVVRCNALGLITSSCKYNNKKILKLLITLQLKYF